MAGGECSCCFCIDTYKYTQCRHAYTHTPMHATMLQGSCKKCSILMWATSVAVCIGVRVCVCLCGCASPGVIVIAAVAFTAAFYYYCCFFAAASVVPLLVNRQRSIMNILKVKILFSV